MPEVEIDLGEQGEVVGAHLASNDVSHQIIEDFMLAANEAVAAHLTENKVGFLRRGHADPDPRKLKEFAEFAGSLGIEIKDALSRFELQRVLAESADKPEAYAVHFGLLRSLKQAIYTPEEEGHYALASEDYCHFTSPIRRYPDLQVHRQLTALLAGKRPRSDFDELAALAEHCTRTERRAETAERELIKIKLLTYLAGHIGEKFHAVIIGVEDFGFFCRLVEFPAEGLVHITALADDYYYLESGTHTLVGRRGGQPPPAGRPDRGDRRPGRHRPPGARPDPGRIRPGRDPRPARPAPGAPEPPPSARPGRPARPATKPKKKGRGADRSEPAAPGDRDSRADRASGGQTSETSGSMDDRGPSVPRRTPTRPDTRPRSPGRSRGTGRAGSGWLVEVQGRPAGPTGHRRESFRGDRVEHEVHGHRSDRDSAHG